MPKGLGSGSKKSQYKKGQSGNLRGPPRKDKNLIAFQEMTYSEFIERLQRFGALNKQQIRSIITDEDTRVLDLVYCRHLFDAMNGKDRARESLYNRLWGKVKEQIEHLGVDRSQIIVTLPDNGRSEVIEKIDVGQ